MTTYTNECPIAGDQSPAKARRGALEYSVPHKCMSCRNMHEARCKLVTNRLKRLDYGFCGIGGSRELVPHPAAGRPIPAKCSGCSYLEERPLYKLVCVKDAELWGFVPRGLDY